MHCTHALLRPRFLDLSGIFSQIAIKAGHEFIVSVDDKYSKACDDRVMYVDYVSCPFVYIYWSIAYIEIW